MTNLSVFDDMKSVYDFGVSVNWDISKMREYGRLNGYSFEIVNRLALSHAEHIGNYDEYKNLVDLFKYQNDEESKKVFDFGVSVNWDISKMKDYCRLHAYSFKDIKKLVQLHFSHNWKIVSSVEFNGFFTQVVEEFDEFIVNPVLLKKGIKTCLLWTNEIEKEEILKYIYDAWLNTKLTKQNLCDMFHIQNDKLNELLFMYERDYLKMSFEEGQTRDFAAIKHSDYSRGKASVVLDKLLKLKSVDEIVNIIDSSGLSSSYLRQTIHNHLVTHVLGDYDEHKAILDNALDQYSAYKAKERKEKRASDKEKILQKYVEETLPNANKLVEEFINSNYDDVQSFIEANEINLDAILDGVQVFNKCLELVKEYNEELYKKYREKVDGKRAQNYAIIIEGIKKIIRLLKDGVVENDIKRPFDLIDYYQITKLSFDNILKIAKSILQQKSISSKDYGLLAEFTKVNKSGEKTVYSDIKIILNEKQEINCEKDSEGYPISGTGEVVSEELKNKLIGYLNQINSPINYRTYKIVFNRYKNGLIDLNDSKKY